MPALKTYSVAQARASILKRTPLGQQAVSPKLKARIKQIFGEDLTVAQVVERIIAEVRSRGDNAVVEFTRKIDGVKLDCLVVGHEEIAGAARQVDPGLYAALKLAAERIRSYHQNQVRKSWVNFGQGVLGEMVQPIERVGIYVPGGTASYPSTVLMSAVPARVAGVHEVALATPPGKDGCVSTAVLAAAHIAQVDRIYKVGGVQAIAAMAYGTESIGRVDKICGPGNVFVALAKKMVFGDVGIDGIQGPTETIIVADACARASYCAGDMLAQAEHDAMASAILITDSRKLADDVTAEIEKRLAGLSRAAIIKESLAARGGIVLVDKIKQAIDLVNEYAPEHLELLVKDPSIYLGKIRNAGGVFVGDYSPEAIGDYVAGPSHIMPTGGSARFSSPLRVDDFVKSISLVNLNQEVLKRTGVEAGIIARAEGLTAHAEAVEERLR